MSDFFEIDFLAVETKKSGDAIALRYELAGYTYIHVVDAGYQSTGPDVADLIRRHYGNPTYIDHVVATHADGDHAGGLRTILEEFDVGALWMLRPWSYADELINRFSTYNSVDHLRRKLRGLYPNLAALEDIAVAKGVPIYEPFQGVGIGAFTVMAPSRHRYLDLVAESERTPESAEEAAAFGFAAFGDAVSNVLAKAVAFVRAAWGEEVFSPEETSHENEMSVVQYAQLCGDKILLTADTGRDGLNETADFAARIGLPLPGIDKVQIPHHGSRRNVSTETLDRLFGPRLMFQPAVGSENFSAIVSSAKEDTHHPRNAVIRAFMHRGAKVFATEGVNLRWGHNAPARAGYGPHPQCTYPDDQEE